MSFVKIIPREEMFDFCNIFYFWDIFLEIFFYTWYISLKKFFHTRIFFGGIFFNKSSNATLFYLASLYCLIELCRQIHTARFSDGILEQLLIISGTPLARVNLVRRLFKQNFLRRRIVDE